MTIDQSKPSNETRIRQLELQVVDLSNLLQSIVGGFAGSNNEPAIRWAKATEDGSNDEADAIFLDPDPGESTNYKERSATAQGKIYTGPDGDQAQKDAIYLVSRIGQKYFILSPGASGGAIRFFKTPSAGIPGATETPTQLTPGFASCVEWVWNEGESDLVPSSNSEQILNHVPCDVGGDKVIIVDPDVKKKLFTIVEPCCDQENVTVGLLTGVEALVTDVELFENELEVLPISAGVAIEDVVLFDSI